MERSIRLQPSAQVLFQLIPRHSDVTLDLADSNLDQAIRLAVTFW